MRVYFCVKKMKISCRRFSNPFSLPLLIQSLQSPSIFFPNIYVSSVLPSSDLFPVDVFFLILFLRSPSYPFSIPLSLASGAVAASPSAHQPHLPWLDFPSACRRCLAPARRSSLLVVVAACQGTADSLSQPAISPGRRAPCTQPRSSVWPLSPSPAISLLPQASSA